MRFFTTDVFCFALSFNILYNPADKLSRIQPNIIPHSFEKDTLRSLTIDYYLKGGLKIYLLLMLCLLRILHFSLSESALLLFCKYRLIL